MMTDLIHRRRPFPRRLLVNPRFQFSLLASIWLIVIIGMVTAALASAFYFTIRIEPSQAAASNGWTGWYGRMALAIFGLLAVMIWVSLALTHRVAGPVYRIMRRLEGVAGGNLQESMRLRRKDEFQELAEQLNVTIESLRREREMAQRRASTLRVELAALEQILARPDGVDPEPVTEEQRQALARAQRICSELTDQIE